MSSRPMVLDEPSNRCRPVALMTDLNAVELIGHNQSCLWFSYQVLRFPAGIGEAEQQIQLYASLRPWRMRSDRLETPSVYPRQPKRLASSSIPSSRKFTLLPAQSKISSCSKYNDWIVLRISQGHGKVQGSLKQKANADAYIEQYGG